MSHFQDYDHSLLRRARESRQQSALRRRQRQRASQQAVAQNRGVMEPLEQRCLLSSSLLPTLDPMDMSHGFGASAIYASADGSVDTTANSGPSTSFGSPVSNLINGLPVMTVTSTAVSETDGTSEYVDFTLTLSEAAINDVYLDYQTITRTAEEDWDIYNDKQTSRLVIAAGQTTGTISVRVYGENTVETDEFFELEITNVQNARLAGDVDRARFTGVIQDDDGGGNKLALNVSNVDLVEGDSGSQNAVFEIELSQASGSDITLNYTTADGSALAGEDYTTTSGSVTFTSGQTKKTVSVPVSGDMTLEDTEYFNLVVTPTGAISSDAQVVSGQAVLLDDDAADGTPVMSLFGASNLESDGTSYYHDFRVLLSEPAVNDIYVDYQVIDGSANEDYDFYRTEQTSSLIIRAGETSGIISIRMNGDNELEADEFYDLELTNVKNAVFAGGAVALRSTAVTVEDDNGGNNLSLDVSDPLLVEGDAGTKTAVFDVLLSQPSATALTFNYTTSDGSAKAGEDYVAKSGSITFQPGETRKSIHVTTNADTTLEGAESFNLVVTPTSDISSSAEIFAGTATLLDDDAADGTPVLNMLGARNLESDGYSQYVDFRVFLSEPAVNDVRVDFETISGTAHEASYDIYGLDTTNSLIIAAGESSAVMSVRIYGDNTVETDEFFELELSNPKNAVFAGQSPLLRASGLILEEDTGGNRLAFDVSDPFLLEGDSGTQSVMFDVYLSRPSRTAITMNYTTADGSALAGEDYTATSGTVTFLPGETHKTVTVSTQSDTKIESAEHFNLVLTPTSDIATAAENFAGMAYLLSDDSATANTPVLNIIGASNLESDGTSQYVDFKLILSEPAINDIRLDYQTIDGSATEGFDFYNTSSNSTLVMSAGENVDTFSIRIIGDNTVEADEFFDLGFYNLDNAVFAGDHSTALATGIILEEDTGGNRLSIDVSDGAVVEGNSGSQEVVFNVTLSRPSTTTISVPYTTVDGSALAGDDYESTSGTLTFLPGETHKAVIVNTIGDLIFEDTEVFSLAVTRPSEIATAAEVFAGEMRLLDDDANGTQLDGAIGNTLPVLSIANAQTRESSGFSQYMDFVVTLSQPATNTVSFRYTSSSGSATDNTDYYTYDESYASISAGDTSTIISIRVKGDTSDEADEFMTLTLTNIANAVFAGGVSELQATGTILDDDGSGSSLGLHVGDAVIEEGVNRYVRQVAIPVTLSRPSATAITMNYTTADISAITGQDYTGQSGSVTFQPGQTTAAIVIDSIGDNEVESTETFNVIVTPSEEIIGGTENTGTVSILDGNVLWYRLIDGALTIPGTAGNDSFGFDAGTTGVFTVARGNLAAGFLTSDVSSVLFLGGSGTDMATLNGDVSANTALLFGNGSGVLYGNGYNATVTQMESVTVNGGSNDIAQLHDSTGNDRLVSFPTSTTLSGTGYSNTVNGYGNITVFGNNGGADDFAEIYDTDGDDHVRSFPEFTDINSSGGSVNGLNRTVHGFDRVNVYGTSGGSNDFAEWWDSTGGDTFQAFPDFAVMNRVNGGSGTNSRYVSGFDRYNAYAVNGGHDFTELYDTDGNDQLRSFGPWTDISSTTGSRAGRYVYAANFEQVNSYAIFGGHNFAEFYDTEGTDRFRSFSNFSDMQSISGPYTGNYRYASGYNQVNSYAVIGGGDDLAELYDTPGNDHLRSFEPFVDMSSDGLYRYVSSYERVNSYAISGGTDFAEFYDTSGNDAYRGTANFSDMSSSVGLYRYASGYDKVNTYRTSGSGTDTATLYAGAGSNHFLGRNNFGQLVGNGFDLYASGYQPLTIDGSSGSTNTKDVSGISYTLSEVGVWS